ncbi:PREDICTED: ATP-binding cassette sub-family G member 4-like, partial [Vollenhovia emeryi]|uniref:ATP-binding cassette sub-family G member 4-like n=1 Tax=Vollenhovia emeryi TaxID=411798 RepID=UPI0005F413E4
NTLLIRKNQSTYDINCFSLILVLEVVTEQRGGDLENLHTVCYDKYKKFERPSNENESTNYKQKCETDATFEISKKSTWQEQKILFLRALICIKRDPQLTKFRLSVHAINGVLLGVVFYNFGNDAEKVFSNIACFFSFMMFLFFANAMPTVQMFPTEASVFLQEHLNNWYSLRSYYSVKILADLPLQILCTSSFLFTAYYMTGQPMEYVRILQMWSVCLLITILGQAIGVFVSVIVGRELGLFLIPACSIPLLLFAGFLVKLNDLAACLQPLTVISFFRFTFEGMMQAIYIDRSNLSCSDIYCFWKSPNKILSLMDMPTILYTSSFLFTAYYMTGQPMEYVRILQIWSVCLLIKIFGQAVGIFISVIAGTEVLQKRIFYYFN